MTGALRALAFGVCLIALSAAAMAASPAYRLLVDGLACPFCAYGIEKKLSAIEGRSNAGSVAWTLEAGRAAR